MRGGRFKGKFINGLAYFPRRINRDLGLIAFAPRPAFFGFCLFAIQSGKFA